MQKSKNTILLFLIVCVLISFLPLSLIYGNVRADSLLVMAKSASKEKKIEIYNKLFLQYEFTDTAKASYYSKLALSLAKKHNYKQGLIDALVNNGYFAEDHGRYALAIEFYKQALRVANKINDKYHTASNYKNIGNVNLRQGNYTEAINNYQQALEISEQIQNNDMISKCLTNIGSIYLYQNNYEKAIQNYEKSIKIAKVLNDKRRIANCLNNIGLACQLDDNYEKAEKSFFKALKILEEINDKGGLADCYHNLGIINTPKDSADTNITQAKSHYEKALQIYQEIGDKKGIALSLNSLGSLLYRQGKYRQSIKYSEKSLNIAQEIGSKDDIKNAYQNIALSYKQLGNYKKAYEYYEKFSLAKDSLNIVQSIQLQAEMEAKYETEKKQKEIELKNIELAKKDAIVKQKTTFQYALIIIVVLVVIFSLFLYNSNRNKKKANKMLHQQNLVIEEKNMDITNSIKYAKRIQESILPPDNLLQEYLKDVFVLYRPKDIVSGDFYWIEKVENKIIYAVVDCTGHGVPGAFISIIGYNGLNRAVNEFKLTKPSDILNKLNEIVNDTIKQSIDESTIRDGMDIAVCSIDFENMKLEYAGANNPLYIVRNKKIIEYKPTKRPIGHFTGINLKSFDNNEISVCKGDNLYVFSDGYADQFGGKENKKFKYSRFKELLINISNKTSGRQKEILNTTITEWMSNSQQIDDICIVGIKIQ